MDIFVTVGTFLLGKIRSEISKGKLQTSETFLILKYTTKCLKCPALQEGSPATG
jgi:hypothetical protein